MKTIGINYLKEIRYLIQKKTRKKWQIIKNESTNKNLRELTDDQKKLCQGGYNLTCNKVI